MNQIKKDQCGFSAVEIIVALVIVLAIGTTGFFVYSHNSKDNKSAITTTSSEKKSKPVKNTPTQAQAASPSYDSQKTKYIKNFDSASASFKSALVNSFFDEAKASCLQAAQEAPDVTDTSTYIVFKKMVRDDFATAQYCGSGGTSIFAKVSSDWKRVGSLAMAPGCSLVDQYKISKEVSATCYLDDGTSKDVTYP